MCGTAPNGPPECRRIIAMEPNILLWIQDNLRNDVQTDPVFCGDYQSGQCRNPVDSYHSRTADSEKDEKGGNSVCGGVIVFLLNRQCAVEKSGGENQTLRGD